MSILDGFYSLASRVNKVRGQDSTETVEGVVSDYLPELSLDMDDGALLKLTRAWEKDWDSSSAKADWLKMSQENENYWKGKQFNKLETEQLRPLVDNIIFEAIETFLPAATRKDPEPMVTVRSTEEQNDVNVKYADVVKNRLSDLADDLKMRLKLKKGARNWLIYLVGVGKVGWDLDNNRPSLKIIRPQKLILDPDGVTDEDGYSGKYVGEYRKMEASILLKILPSTSPEEMAMQEYIKAEVKQDLGTDLQFIEWWTDEYMCWTYKDKVLLKKKNPHWNYKPEAPEAPEMPMDESGEPTEDPTEEGAETPAMEAGEENTEMDPTQQEGDIANTEEMDPSMAQPEGMPQLPTDPTLSPIQLPPMPAPEPNNHFVSPRKPYIFISIFNLGKTPTDETSLLTQVLPSQDLINKRLKQIDKNADGMNNGLVVSEERSGLTKEEAKGVTDALRRGGTVVIPSGAPGDAVARFPAPALPSDVFNQLADTRIRLRDTFGVRGITPGGIQNDDTVRGKIITRGLDTDRIGGGITEYLEQFADEAYNWFYQLELVYDDIFVGNATAKLPKINITVKEGSLLPKDATTIANQAIDLASSGHMALVDLYKRLEYTDPEELAANVWLQQNAPELLFPNNKLVQQAMAMKHQQMQQMAATEAQGQKKSPSESINYKDLDAHSQAQMLLQAGIRPDPATLVAHHQQQNAPPAQPPGRGGQQSMLSQVQQPQ